MLDTRNDSHFFFFFFNLNFQLHATVRAAQHDTGPWEALRQILSWHGPRGDFFKIFYSINIMRVKFKENKRQAHRSKLEH
jgi:hypothetical protein